MTNRKGTTILEELIFKHMRGNEIWSFKKFAYRAGFSTSTLTNLVKRPTTLKLEQLIKLARALEMPPHELLYKLAPDELSTPQGNHDP